MTVRDLETGDLFEWADTRNAGNNGLKMKVDNLPMEGENRQGYVYITGRNAGKVFYYGCATKRKVRKLPR